MLTEIEQRRLSIQELPQEEIDRRKRAQLGIDEEQYRAWVEEGHVIDLKTDEDGNFAFIIFFKVQEARFEGLSFRRAVKIKPGGTIEYAKGSSEGVVWEAFNPQSKNSPREAKQVGSFAQFARFSADALPFDASIKEVVYTPPI